MRGVFWKSTLVVLAIYASRVFWQIRSAWLDDDPFDVDADAEDLERVGAALYGDVAVVL